MHYVLVMCKAKLKMTSSFLFFYYSTWQRMEYMTFGTGLTIGLGNYFLLHSGDWFLFIREKKKKQKLSLQSSCVLSYPFSEVLILTVLKQPCLFHFSQGILLVVLLAELFTLDWHWLQAPYIGGYLRAFSKQLL